jgi:hypothetical protein
MAFTDESQVYEAMGLEVPQETPTAEETPMEETAETVPNEETPPEEQEEQVEAPESEAGGEDPLEKLRRELTEQHQRELKEARAQAARERDEQFASMGLTNPYTKQPFKSWAEYQEYQQQQQEEQWDRMAKQTGMSREQLDQLIAKHPDVVKGMEAQAQAQAAQEAAQQQQLRAKLDADIRTISTMCPEVRDVETLVAHPSYEQVAAKMRAIHGLSVADAFVLVNHAQLAAGNAGKTAQRVRNNLAGKNHMQRTEQRGSGGDHMTAEQEAMYAKLLPGLSRTEIAEFHRKHMKGA